MKAVYPVSNLAYYSQKLLRAPGLLYNSLHGSVLSATRLQPSVEARVQALPSAFPFLV